MTKSRQMIRSLIILFFFSSVMFSVSFSASTAGAYTISGGVRVLNSNPVVPIAGATVRLEQSGVIKYTTTSSASGTYSIAGVPAGTYLLVAIKFGYENWSSTRTISSDLTGQNIAMVPLPTGSISGGVRDSVTSAPLVGATVRLEQDIYIRFTTTTDGAGNYSFSGVPAGTYNLVGLMGGYQNNLQAKTINGGDNLTFQNIAMVPTTGRISGGVRDSVTSAPLVGATVRLEESGVIRYTTTTDGTGNYAFVGVTPGTYNLTAFMAGYQNALLSKTINAGDNLTFQNIAMVPLAAISGGVRDSVTSDPLVGATVRLEQSGVVRYLTTTNATGNYSFTNVEAGSYNLVGLMGGYQNASLPKTLNPGDNLTLQNIAMVPTTGRISGRVYDSLTGASLSGATVRLEQNNVILYTATSDGAGNYLITGVTPGQYVVVGLLLGAYQNAALLKTIDAGVSTALDVPMAPLASTSGRVTDSVTGAVLSGATVRLEQSGTIVYTTTVDGGGNYAISGVTPGQYTVVALQGGYQNAVLLKTLSAGVNTVVDIAMVPTTGRISGGVRDNGTSAPLVGATVRLEESGVIRYTTTTDGSGIYAFVGVTPGTYNLTAFMAGYQNASLPKTINAGDNLTLQNIAMVPTTANHPPVLNPIGPKSVNEGSPLSFTVTASDQDAGDNLILSITNMPIGAGFAAATGVFSWTPTSTQAGVYSVTFIVSDGTATDSEIVSITVNDVPPPTGGTISGVVSDASSGQGIAGAQVQVPVSGGSTLTNSNGSYVLSNVPIGSYTVTATASKYASRSSAPITVVAGGTSTANMDLTPNGPSETDYQGTYNPAQIPAKTDELFIARGAGSTPLAGYQTGPITFNIPVDRYYGAVDGTGRLTNYSTLVSRGVISNMATLTLYVWDLDEDEVLTVRVNNIRSYGSPQKGVGNRWTEIPILVRMDDLRFPNMGSNGSRPSERENQIKIDVSPAGQEKKIRVQWASLEIKGIRPIVFVHGWNANPAYNYNWTRDPSFKKNFDDAGFTTAVVALDPIGSILHNGRELLPPQLRAIATRAGVEKVNIVAHSKGGLDTRMYMKVRIGTNDATFPLIENLFMLATPNQGTPWADVAWRHPHIAYAFGLGIGGKTDAVRDMRVEDMKIFNNVVKSNPGTNYYGVAGEWNGRLPRGAECGWADLTICPLLDAIGKNILRRVDGRNDGIVPVISVSGGGWITFQPDGFATTNRNHIDMFRDPTPTDPTSLFQFIRSKLVIQLTGARSLSSLSGVGLTGALQSLAVQSPAVADLTAIEGDRAVALQWSAPSGSVRGYKVYYDADGAGAPYDGTAAVEGPSPIDIGFRNSFTLTGLTPDQAYYFAVTSYGADGVESLYSSEATAVPSGNGSLITVSGAINPGQVVSQSIPIDGAPEVVFGLLWPNGVLAFTVRDPLGQVIPTGDPAVYESVDGIITYTITNPLPGDWTLEVSGTNIPDPQDYLITATFANTLTLKGDLPQDWYPLNQAAKITGTLREGAVPISGASVTATVTLPDASLTTVMLRDDGTLGDDVSGDGIYTGTLLTSQGGHYFVSLAATGQSSAGRAFQREATTGFSVSAGTARLTGSYTESLIDSNGDGLSDALEITVGLDVATAGDYELVGRLVDSKGAEITWASATATLDVGPATQPLSFDGQAIHEHGADGPWALKELVVVDRTRGDNQVDYRPNAFTTSAYSAAQFQRAAVAFGGLQGDEGVDTDGNGRFDYLKTTIGLDVVTAAAYSVDARLTDAAGATISRSHAEIFLNLGSNTVDLYFPGRDIVAKGVGGSYVVTDLMVSQSEGSVTFTDTLTTSAYAVADFDGANLPPVLSPIGAKSVDEGTLLSFSVTGSDPDGDALSFNATGLPAGATLDPVTGLFSWVPTFTQAGAYTVTITVSDWGLSSAPEIVTIMVNDVTSPTLAVTKAGSGDGTVTSSLAGINCGPTCSALFAGGTMVTLTATPDPISGSYFAGWSGACTGMLPCVVTVNTPQLVTATFEAAAPPSVPPLANISSRSRVLTADNVLIGGFIIDGTTPKTVLLRARGPSMGGAPFNIPGVLANPTMQLYSGATVIAQNNDWQITDPLCGLPATSCGIATEISATAMDPCQPNPGQTIAPPGCAQESALLATLPPGGYTTIVSGVGGGTGVGLVEVFEADTITTARLINISSRSRVETGDNVLIGGLIIGGTTPKTVLLRARGPSMGGAPFNIPGVLANPTMQLYSGATVITQNDNWQTTDPLCGSPATACGDGTQIAATVMDPCQPNPGQSVAPPGCSQESAILVTLPPGGYTTIVSGVGGGVGVGLVEVFEVP